MLTRENKNIFFLSKSRASHITNRIKKATLVTLIDAS
jgi:hypothetical protein